MYKSLWLQQPTEHSKAALGESIETDVCIIGGGLSGIMTAYHLSKAGKDVVLLEGDSVLGGATGHSTGKLTAQHGAIYQTLIKQFGSDGASLYYKLNQKAVSSGFDLVGSDVIQPSTSILYTQEEFNRKKLEDEWDAYKQLNISGTMNPKSEIPYPLKLSVSMSEQAQIHPVRFGREMLAKAMAAGTKVYEHTRVQHVDIQNKKAKTHSGHTVSCKDLVIASHYPIEALRGLHLFKLEINRSYIIAFKTPNPYKGQYLSVDTAVRSIRTALIDGDNYLLLAGPSHKAGTKSDTYKYYDEIEAEGHDRFDAKDIPFKWSAQDPETPDLLPYVGQLGSGTPHVWIATGFRKWGISNSLVAGQLISDGILGTPNKGLDLYSPSHTKLGTALAQALKIGSQVAVDFVGGYITRTSTPRCTHMGCKTRWNEADETWDCPCHGSRFSKEGLVIEGPAVDPLEL